MNTKRLIISVLVPLLTGFVGSFFTARSIPLWYETLTKPSFTPPNWVFAPVWTLLYILMGVAFYLIWNEADRHPETRKSYTVYWVQLALNLIWSPIFFGARNPELALLIILLLWGYIVATVIQFYRFKKFAAYILIPYLLWVSYATALNAAIVLLN